jgi:YD repeat-containing protein
LDDQLEVYGDNTYNQDGYLEEKTTPQGTTTYTYGIFGELKEVTTPTNTIEYLHNANNQRSAKK